MKPTAIVFLASVLAILPLGAGDADRPASIGGSMFVLAPNQAKTEKIVFLCDASGSILNKYPTLHRQLFKAVAGLHPHQSFNLVFMQEAGSLLLSGKLLKATPENQLAADTFLQDKVKPRGETNPIPALDAAFAQNPQVVFLLTDGDFPDNNAVLKRVAELNAKHAVQINTIAFIGEGDRDTEFMKILEKIAKDSGGVYRKVDESKAGD